MSDRTAVSGYSDDLIYVEGPAISEEFPASEDSDVLAFSTGVVLRVTYDQDGVWRITPLAGSDLLEHVIAPTDDDDNYSDQVYLNEHPAWVVHGTAFKKARAARHD